MQRKFWLLLEGHLSLLGIVQTVSSHVSEFRLLRLQPMESFKFNCFLYKYNFVILTTQGYALVSSLSFQ